MSSSSWRMSIATTSTFAYAVRDRAGSSCDRNRGRPSTGRRQRKAATSCPTLEPRVGDRLPRSFSRFGVLQMGASADGSRRCTIFEPVSNPERAAAPRAAAAPLCAGSIALHDIERPVPSPDRPFGRTPNREKERRSRSPTLVKRLGSFVAAFRCRAPVDGAAPYFYRTMIRPRSRTAVSKVLVVRWTLRSSTRHGAGVEGSQAAHRGAWFG